LMLVIITAGFAINPQPEPPRQINLRILEAAPPPGFDQSKIPVLRSQFVISPISALKISLGNRPPTKIMSAKTGSPAANRFKGMLQAPPVNLVGNPYAENKGLVLDALHTKDKATNSALVVYNVMWNYGLTDQIAAQDPQTKLTVMTPGEGPSHFVEAYFSNLAPGLHTYMLTLGTSAKADLLRMSIAGQSLPGNQLIANPNTNEVRVCFTFDGSGNYGGNFDAIIWFNYDKPLGYSTLEYFHHLQLAQLD